MENSENSDSETVCPYWNRTTRVVHCKDIFRWLMRRISGQEDENEKKNDKGMADETAISFHSDAVTFLAASTNKHWSSVCPSPTLFSVYYIGRKITLCKPATKHNVILFIFLFFFSSQARALTTLVITMKQASLCWDSVWLLHLLRSNLYYPNSLGPRPKRLDKRKFGYVRFD